MDEGQSAESEAGASDRIQQHDAVHAPADPPDTEAPEPAAPAAPDVDVEVNTGDGAAEDSQDDSTSGEES